MATRTRSVATCNAALWSRACSLVHVHAVDGHASVAHGRVQSSRRSRACCHFSPSHEQPAESGPSP
eukprot:1005982-Rhodomonas_salina.1